MQLEPVGELDARYSDPGATAHRWATALDALITSRIFWLSTVRPDHRPHVTPLLALWHDGGLYFCTGADERKAKNLAVNGSCALTTGTNADSGLDLVVEGEAVRVTDDRLLRTLAVGWDSKYGAAWHFDVQDGAFAAGGRNALVFGVSPGVVFGFGKSPYSQTRWRFTRDAARPATLTRVLS